MCDCNKSVNPITYAAVPEPTDPCVYTKDQLINWKLLLFCVKSNELYTEADTNLNEVNSALGIVISAVNNGSNICYYQKYLDQIVPLIHRIINLSQCQ